MCDKADIFRSCQHGFVMRSCIGKAFFFFVGKQSTVIGLLSSLPLSACNRKGIRPFPSIIVRPLVEVQLRLEPDLPA